jgi:hypothetical protein
LSLSFSSFPSFHLTSRSFLSLHFPHSLLSHNLFFLFLFFTPYCLADFTSSSFPSLLPISPSTLFYLPFLSISRTFLALAILRSSPSPNCIFFFFFIISFTQSCLAVFLLFFRFIVCPYLAAPCFSSLPVAKAFLFSYRFRNSL